jgi:hypothetical protein
MPVTGQSLGQVLEDSPLSQNPFPHIVPGVKEVEPVIAGVQPDRTDASRIIEIMDKTAIDFRE